MVFRCRMFECRMFEFRMFESDRWRGLKHRFRHNWRLPFAIFVPILFSPIAWSLHDIIPHSGEADPEKKFKTAYVVSIMAMFWVFEVIPVAVTSLFPLVLFPLLGVQDAAVVSQNYMKESNMIFLGAIILSLAIEYCGLHIRCALRVISIFGTNPARIMLGTMVITALLAMWLSDTSCTSMLLPIISALLAAMFQEEQEDLNVPEPVGHNSVSAEPSLSSVERRSRRRESCVFANAAMDRFPTVGSTSSRRKSRTSINFTQQSQNHHEMSEMSNSKKSTSSSHNGRHDSLKQVASMTVIMEGVAEEPNEEEEEEDNQEEPESGKPPLSILDALEEYRFQLRIRKMLLFAVAYAASIGGTGSLVGTGPIKVFKELAKRYELEKSDKYIGITFATWMGFNIPPLLINILVVWVFLILRYMGLTGLKKIFHSTAAEKNKIKEYLDTEYKKLGPITSHEVGVLVIFIFVVLLWLFRDPQIIHGWDSLIHSAKSGDSTAGMLGAVLLFVVPKSWSFLKKEPYTQPTKYEALLDWKFVSTNAPWGYVILIGSGYALADASEVSGLSHYIAEQFTLLDNLSKPLLLLITMVITSVITEFVSNTAAANLLLPIIFTVSCRITIHPLFLTMASAISASYAFMLPISSPPNAMIFATGELETKEMICNGLTLNILCCVVLYICMITYGEFLFHFSSFTGVPCP